MEKSTVYFTDFRCPVGISQLDKLKKLCVTAGIKDIENSWLLKCISENLAIWLSCAQITQKQ